jgi:error-prone DNA polymerase
MSVAPFAELCVASNFSFLHGASHADELVLMAKALGLSAIGIADRNTMAGVVRAHVSAKEHGIRLLVGARLVTLDGFEIVTYPQDRAAYARLTKLLTLGNRRAGKGQCHLTLDDILAADEGQCFIAMPPPMPDAAFATSLSKLAGACPRSVSERRRGNGAALRGGIRCARAIPGHHEAVHLLP